MTILKKDIKYLSKDFTEFRKNLVNFAKTYFKDTVTDFNESDPATMFIEIAAYVGDVLSFYVDKQLKESLLLHAEEKKNVVRLAQALGYKPKPVAPAKAKIDIYQLLPSVGSGESITPNFNYALQVEQGMQISSNNDSSIVFKTLDSVDFAFSSSYDPTEVTIYSTIDGDPEYYLLKKSVNIEASEQKSTTFTFTDPIKYNKILLQDTNVISIDNIVDSDSNNWYEVDYLSQDTIFKKVTNVYANDPTLYQHSSQVPYLLKLLRVPKRFITRYTTDNKIELQFGAGITTNVDEEIIPSTDNVGMQIPTGVSKLNYDWNVANFMYTDAYGEVPQNTTLTIKYSVGGGIGSNVISNSLTEIVEIEFEDLDSSLDSTIIETVKNSIAVNNPIAATGGKDSETVEEIRNNALAYFAAQDRAVTKDDYITRVYSMPSKFGSIAKAYITQDENITRNYVDQEKINPSILNLYILSYDSNKNLTIANDALKQNLKTYIDKYRMATDSIIIKNGFIVNFQLKFEIVVLPDYNSNEVLLNCINELKKHFDISNWQINQPIVKSDILKLLNITDGVQSVIKLEFKNLFSGNYSNNIYDITAATTNDVIFPSLDPMCFEIKYPNVDISGKVVNY